MIINTKTGQSTITLVPENKKDWMRIGQMIYVLKHIQNIDEKTNELESITLDKDYMIDILAR
jgi:alanine racemase